MHMRTCKLYILIIRLKIIGSDHPNPALKPPVSKRPGPGLITQYRARAEFMTRG